MIGKDNIKIDIRYSNTANVLVFEDNGRRFETCCFTYPKYKNNIFSLSITSDGCSVGCKFCDVPNAGRGINLSADNIVSQVVLANGVMRECYWVDKNKPIKIALNRAGEPLLNPIIFEALARFSEKKFAKELDVQLGSLEMVSIMPDNQLSRNLLNRIINFSTIIEDDFYIQASIHTTDEVLRRKIIPLKKLMPLKEISYFGERFYEENNGRRQMTLTFHLMDNLPVNAGELVGIFNPEKFRVRVAYYSPTTVDKKSAFPRSNMARIERVVRDFRDLGYKAYASLISPGEHEVNTHPGAGLSLFTHLETQR